MQTMANVDVLKARIERLEEQGRAKDARLQFLEEQNQRLYDENERFRKAIIAKDNRLLRLVRQARRLVYDTTHGRHDDFWMGNADSFIDEANEALGDQIQDDEDEE